MAIVMLNKYIVFFVTLFLFIKCTQSKTIMADKVIINAEIWTGDDAQPQAQAMAIKTDTLVAVGTNDEIQKLVDNNTEVIDAKGNFITPGFIDAHVHFLTGGFNLSSVQLRDAESPVDFIERMREFAKDVPSGTWITGGDWDHTNWNGDLPTRHWIDSVTPENPVWINRLDGHMALANTVAIEIAGIGQHVEEMEGGEIERDEDGQLTGIFKDNAMPLISKAVPEPSVQMEDRAMEAAMRYVAEQGVTSVHNVSGYMDVFERFRDSNRLKTRIYAGMPISQWRTLVEKVEKEGKGDKWLSIGSLKGFMDGSLGSHTAAFFEPFDDMPDETGLLVTEPEQMYAWAKAADSAGMHVMIHAIGDRANSLLLDIYEKITNENGERDRRFRIEHAQHIAPKDIERFARLNVIASMQPYHTIDDGRWAEEIIGPERVKTTYAYRDLLDAGATIAFGSDWFVAPPTPLDGIYAAVTRRTLDGEHPNGWVPEQKITVAEALKAYTRDAAYAAFEEETKGTLEPGKLADFVVLGKNLFNIPPENIRDVKVLMTVVGGEKVYGDKMD